MDDRLRAICDTHGAFLTREALALGMDERTFRREVQAGRYRRVRHGTYSFPDRWDSLDEAARHIVRARSVQRRAQTEVVLSHTSAIVQHTTGHWGLDLTDVHVTRLDGRAGRREAGVRQHQGRLRPEDVIEISGVRLTSPTKSALDLTTVADLERSVVVMDALLHAGLTTKRALAQRYLAGMVQCPHTLRTELAVSLSDGRSASAGESRLRYFCWSRGLPMPALQHPVYSRAGRHLGTTDFWWAEHQVAGEFDGMVKYTRLLRPGEDPATAVVREKRREEAIVEETGCTFLRFSWSDLSRPQELEARIRRALARRQRPR